MSRRRLVLSSILAAIVLTTGYGAASAMVWDKLTNVPDDCQRKWGANSPESFTVPETYALDTAPLAMPAPEEIRLPSRDPGITVAAWWIPAALADAPAVVVVHGFTACRRDHAVLLPAGMLYRHGFSVLLIDLRDHGDSTIEDRRFAGGTDEYRDVLGAWDWLQAEQGVPAEKIGLVGISLGAATVLMAAGRESRVAAVWEDSSYADLDSAIRAELGREGYPAFLSSGGVFAALLISGDDLASYDPLDAVSRLDGRPLFITHGESDTRLSVQYAHALEAAIRDQNGSVETWIIPGAEHTEAMVTHANEYEEHLVGFFTRNLP